MYAPVTLAIVREDNPNDPREVRARIQAVTVLDIDPITYDLWATDWRTDGDKHDPADEALDRLAGVLTGLLE